MTNVVQRVVCYNFDDDVSRRRRGGGVGSIGSVVAAAARVSLGWQADLVGQWWVMELVKVVNVVGGYAGLGECGLRVGRQGLQQRHTIRNNKREASSSSSSSSSSSTSDNITLQLVIAKVLSSRFI